MPQPQDLPSPIWSDGTVNSKQHDQGGDDDFERGRTLTRLGRKRRRPVNPPESLPMEAVSKRTRGATGNVLHSAPSISPTTDQLSQSRSPGRSPIRKQLGALKTATPPMLIARTQIRPDECQSAQELWEVLNAAAESARIPNDFQHYLSYAGISASWFGPASAEDSTEEMLWRMCRIHNDALACEVPIPKDENAWAEVVSLVVRTALYGCNEDRSKHEQSHNWEFVNIQTQTIDERFLPKSSTISLSKKTDFTLNLRSSNQELEDLRRKAATSAIPMSHMKDSFTSEVPIAIGFEVKPTCGSLDEAKLQMTVFSTAALAHLNCLLPSNQEDPPTGHPVLLGWTVVGHSWSLWFVWEDEHGAVHIRNPGLDRPLGTSGYKELFTLVAVLRRAFKWLRADYWPFFRELFTAYLERETKRSEGPG